jgi:hypothetical protein
MGPPCPHPRQRRTHPRRTRRTASYWASPQRRRVRRERHSRGPAPRHGKAARHLSHGEHGARREHLSSGPPRPRQPKTTATHTRHAENTLQHAKSDEAEKSPRVTWPGNPSGFRYPVRGTGARTGGRGGPTTRLSAACSHPGRRRCSIGSGSRRVVLRGSVRGKRKPLGRVLLNINESTQNYPGSRSCVGAATL